MNKNLKYKLLNEPRKITEFRNRLKGKIITFEGVDAVGKSTQSALFTDFLQSSLKLDPIDDMTFYTFPDYQTPTGKTIKKLLTEKNIRRIDEYSLDGYHQFSKEEYLEILMKNNKYEKLPQIRDDVRKGKVVVMNRYVESQYVYGTVNGFDLNWLQKINKDLLKSDYVFMLHEDIDIIIKRIMRKKNIDIYELDFEYMKKIQQQYLIFQKRFRNWIYINCNERSSVDIASQIISKLYFLLKVNKV